jgi:hypothetical protein
MVILEKIIKNIKFVLIMTKKYFIWIEPGPTVISDAGLITRVGFAALPTDFLFSVRTSTIRSTTYSLRCKTEKFEAILFHAAAAAAAGACAWLIATHLCRWRQWFTPNAPSWVVERTRGLLKQRQTPLVAQPSRRRRTAAARAPPHVPLRGVVGGGTAIVSLEQDGI